jgi:hypothetical protein
MRLFATLILAVVVSGAPALANHHFRPPAPPAHPPVQPPVINRPPVPPQQQILQQRQLQRGATQRAGATVVSIKSIDDKVGDWGDFATLSDAELAALFKEMGIGDATFDRNAIKTMMLGEMAGSGAPPEVLQQMSAQLDGMLGMLESTIGASMASFPTDMAREFKQIYAANCCGKAQFIAALGAAETKLANAFRNDFANSMANMAAQNGSPPSAVASMRGALTGGTTTIIYDAGDAAVIAASNMVGNGRGGPTNVASNTNPGGNSSQAPPRTPGGNSNPGGGSNQAPPLPTNSVPSTTTTGNPAPPPPAPTNTVPPPPTNPAPATAVTGNPAPPPAPQTNMTPGTPTPPMPTTSVPATPVTGNPAPPPPQQQVTPNPGGQPPTPPPGNQPAALSNLVTPPGDPAPVTLVPGGIDTPPDEPLDTSGLLGLTPGQDTPPVGMDDLLPDPTNTQSTGPTVLDQVSSYRPPAEDPPPPCTTPECIQRDLDNLAIDREVLDFERRIEPFIQSLDTLGNIGTAVGGIGCASLNPACAALPLGIAFKGLKVLIVGAKDAKAAGIRGVDKYERLGTFVGSSAEGAAVEVVKEGLGLGVSKVAGAVVGGEAMETFGGAVFDASTGGVIDAGADVLEGELKLNELPGDVARVYTGGGL